MISLSMSRRTLGRMLVTFAVGTLLSSRAVAAQEAGIAIGATAPGAAVSTLDGKAIDLRAMMNGTPVVMEFWATWCPLCKKLEPALSAARAKYAGKVRFVGVGVAQNQSAERQQAYVTQQQMTGEFVFDKDGAAVAAYKAPHTSYVVVIDAKGTVVYTGVGAEQDIDAAVQKAFTNGHTK
jgi:thiol-disulfide isomerase/thioredoxin